MLFKFFQYEGRKHIYFLLFHQKIVNKDDDLIKCDHEFLFSNTETKFSLLGHLDETFKNDRNEYEFILEYPETKLYGHWTQEINPLEAEPDSDVGVNIKKDSTWSPNRAFVGLHQSSTKTQTYLEGVNTNSSLGPEFYYSIGLKNLWGDGIPGYTTNRSFNEVYLWCQIPKHFFLNYISTIFTCQKHYHFNYIHFIYILIIIK